MPALAKCLGYLNLPIIRSSSKGVGACAWVFAPYNMHGPVPNACYHGHPLSDFILLFIITYTCCLHNAWFVPPAVFHTT